MARLYTPSPELLLVGAGNLYLDRIVNGARTGYRHAGNVDLLEYTTDDTKLQKFSSMSPSRPLYAERLQRRIQTLRFNLDEHSAENVALITQSTIISGSQLATPVVGEVLFAAVPAATLGAALGGATFKLAKVGEVSALTLNLGAAALVLNTDYTVNLVDGTVRILPTSVAVTNDVDDLTADYTPTALTAIRRITGGTESVVEVAGLFVPAPTTGPSLMLEWWRGALTPAGPLSFISEDWSTMQAQVVFQDDSVGNYGGSSQFPTYAITVLEGV